MAEGAWVPAFDSLWTSPKTASLSRAMRVSRYHAGGLFLDLMRWMRDNVETGDLGPVDRAAIARALGLATTRDKDDLASARGMTLYRQLVEARFLTDDPRGHVIGWEDGPGKLVTSRREDRLRKAHERSGHLTPEQGCPKCRRLSDGQKPNASTLRPPVPSVSTGQATDVHRTSERRERTERTENPLAPSAGAGHAGATGQPSVDEIVSGASSPWREALVRLRDGMSANNFVTWFRDTSLVLRERGGARVEVPNAFATEWLRTKYVRQIRMVLEELEVIEQGEGLEVVERGTVLESETAAAELESEPEIPSSDQDAPYARARGGA